MRKNICAVIIIAVCFVFVPEKSFAEDPSETRLLDDLLGHIYATEKICGDFQWALDYFERFDKKRNWENLQLARAALVIAKVSIEKTVQPKQKITADDYKKFMNRKINVSFLEAMQEEFKANQTTLLNACKLIETRRKTACLSYGDIRRNIV